MLGQALRLFPGLTGERMLDDHDRVLWQSQSLRPVLCYLGEGVRDHCHGGAAAFFSFDTIVETPRCTGASIGHGVDNRIAFACELV